ncbi:unnamed protein product, partial [Prorocentrum cordatum]
MRPRRPRATSARPLDSLRVSGRSTRPPSRSHGSPHQCPRRAEGGETRDQEERGRGRGRGRGGTEQTAQPPCRPLRCAPRRARAGHLGLSSASSPLRNCRVLVGGGAASAGQHGGQLRRGWLGRQRRRRDVQRLLAFGTAVAFAAGFAAGLAAGLETAFGHAPCLAAAAALRAA